MTINDLYSLSVSYSSIEKIESFIAISKSTNKIDYLRAMILLAKFYSKLNEENKSIYLIEELFKEGFIKKNPLIAIDALDVLIEIYLNNEDYDEAIKYINKKHEYVGSKLYLYLYDLVRFYHKKKAINEEKQAIIEMINIDMPDDIRVDIYEKMIDILIFESSFSYAKMYSDELFIQLEIIDNQKAYIKNVYKNAYILYNLNDYSYLERLETIEIADLEIDALRKILIIKTYLKLEDYKKCYYLESTFNESISKYNDYIKREFYQVAINLYTTKYNKDALEYYEDSLNKLKLVKEDKRVAKKELKSILSLDEKKAKPDIAKEELYNLLSLTNELIEEYKNIKIDDQIRNILMYMSRILNKKINIRDIILIYNDSMWHYKKDRVYDKKIPLLTDTLFEPLFDKGEEIIFNEKADLISYNDIITNESFIRTDIENAYARPIKNNLKTIGGLVFYGDSKLLKGFNYELLNIFSNLLELNILHSIDYNNKKNDFELYSYIFENINALIKYKVGNDIYLSNDLAKILKTNNHIDELTFYSKIDSNYINYYKEFFDKNEALKYKINDRIYIEKIKKINEEISISILSDITNEEIKNINEYNKVYKDYITGLKNRYQLESEFKIDKKKMSIVIIDIANFKEINQLYGITKSDQVLKNIAKLLSDTFNYDNVYKLMSDEFLVILDYNDQRAVKKNLNIAFENINQQMKKIDYRLDIYLQAGVVRYPTQKDEDRIDRLIHYASFAKRIAKEERKPNSSKVSMFDSEQYRRYKDEDITTAHILEAINNNLIRINYTPIINKKSKRLHQYEITFLITNYDIPHEEIIKVARLRNILSSVEKYLFRKSIEQLNEIMTIYKKYYNILIPITKIDKEFLDMIKKYIAKSKVLVNAITLLVEDYTYVDELRNLGIHVAGKNISDLFKGLDYYVVEYNDRMNEETIKSLYELCNSLNTKLIMINASSCKYDIELTRLDSSITYDEVIKIIKKTR